MTKVLVYGLKDPIGGVERVVFEYVRGITKTHNDITFHFMFHADSFSLEKEIKEMGCDVVYLPSRKDNYKAYKTALEKVFENNDYSAVWGNYSGLTNIDLLKSAKKHNIPIRIAHSHVTKLFWGSRITALIGPYLHNFNKFILPSFATDYWACSIEAGKFMFPKSTHNKILVVNNSVDTDIFYPSAEIREKVRKDFGFGDDTVVIGHVARICEAKNQAFLLKAFAEALKIQPNARLLFVGDGELREQIHKVADELNLNDAVVFTGERDDVATLLNAMDVFVLPSLAEGFGICVIEAQACNVPCVVSDVVPTQTDITNSTKYVSLNQSAKEWAEIILQQANVKLTNGKENVINNNFEIYTEANKTYMKLMGK